MNFKRLIGIVICAAGIALLVISGYIKHRVAEGKADIASGQQKIDQGKTLFGLNPVTKEVGQQLFINSGEKKIKEGSQQVHDYEILANRLQIGAIVCIIVGVGIFAISFKKRKA